MRLSEVKDMRVYVAKLIMSKFRKCLDGIQCNIYQQYNYSKIRIDNEDGSLYIWVSLRWHPNSKTFTVDISNITLPEKYRRCGLFTSIIKSLKRSKYVDNIIVSNILTEEMHLACRKLNMAYTGDNNLLMCPNCYILRI